MWSASANKGNFFSYHVWKFAKSRIACWLLMGVEYLSAPVCLFLLSSFSYIQCSKGTPPPQKKKPLAIDHFFTSLYSLLLLFPPIWCALSWHAATWSLIQVNCDAAKGARPKDFHPFNDSAVTLGASCQSCSAGLAPFSHLTAVWKHTSPRLRCKVGKESEPSWTLFGSLHCLELPHS